MEKETLIARQILKDYDEFIIRISELSGMAFHSKSIYKHYLKTIRKNGNEKGFYLGSRLSFYSPLTDRLVKDGESYEVVSENVDEKVCLLERRLCNYYSAQGYEAFESFLRMISARFIVKYNKRATDYDIRLGFRNLKSCKMYLSSNYRDNLDLLKLLRHLMPNLNKAFEQKKELQNYFHFYKVYGQARHCITHSGDLVTDNILKRFAKNEIGFLNKYFGVDKKNNIINTTTTIDRLLEGLGVMSYLIITSFDFKNPKIREH